MRRLLVITGGHRVAMDEFLGSIASVCADRDWVWAHSTQPSAQRWLRPENAGQWDAILLHDLPGLHLKRGEPPTPIGPDPEVAAGLIELLKTGQPLVVLHHAIASWPGWEGWAEAIGGRFLYAPGRLRGEDLPSSGYRKGRFTISPTAPKHPVCAGVEPFEVDDELYFAPYFADRITPLLEHNADLDGAAYQDTFDEVSHGSSTGVTCEGRGHASPLMGWTTVAGHSPVVTLLMGDGPSTFENPMFRRLMGNAIDWVSGHEARSAALAKPTTVPLP